MSEVVMNRHLYLRAYMAGIVLPTVFLLIVVSALALVRVARHESLPIGPDLIFPMAIVPNVFGLWDMLYVKLHQRWQHPIGLHGAALPFFIGPAGFAFATATGIARLQNGHIVYFELYWIPYWYFLIAPFIALAVYYLVWKYVVGYFNRVLELPT